MKNNKLLIAMLAASLAFPFQACDPEETIPENGTENSGSQSENNNNSSDNQNQQSDNNNSNNQNNPSENTNNPSDNQGTESGNNDNSNHNDPGNNDNNNSGNQGTESGDSNNPSGNQSTESGDSNNTEEPSGQELPLEVQEAFKYLNQIRANPSAFSEEIGVDLSAINAIHALEWNDQLYKAAQHKAEDMATRNYFAHVDPDGYGMNYYINQAGYTLIASFLSSNHLNYFESIAAGNKTGKATIKQLLYDKGAKDDDAGHRKHLLGYDEFWSDCYDIGIGMAQDPNSQYKYYWSVIIAKHNF